MGIRKTYPRDKEVKTPTTRSLDELLEAARFDVATATLDAQAQHLERTIVELVEIIDFLIDRVVFTDSERFK